MSVLSNTIVITPALNGTLLAPYELGLPRLVCGIEAGWLPREFRINLSRDLCQRKYMSHYMRDYEWILLMDSDVVIDVDCFAKLKAQAGIGKTACADTKEGKKSHVICACALVHRTDYIKVDYLSKPTECQCCKLPNPFYVEGAFGYERK